MPPAGHALLGASSAHRWLACPPSARLQESAADTTSEAAAEGTLAHELVELKLNRLLKGKPAGKATLAIKNNPLFHPVMEDHTNDYIDYVCELFAQAQQSAADAKMLSETRLDYSMFVPGGYGTADTIIISDGVMHVVDFKYGKGVRVEAEGNPQLRLYGLGALATYGLLYDIREVQMHIVQPRLDNTSSERLYVPDLILWGTDYVRPRAQQAYDGEGEFCAGEHCRFCKVSATCRARVEYVTDMAKHEFADPALLTDEEIAEMLPRVDELVRWAKQVKDWALEQAVNHEHTLPGYKLVEGRANRRLLDPQQAGALLEEAGYSRDELYTLKGLTDLEAVVGKKALSEHLGSLIHKPAGKPVLVPESDKRPAISSAARAADMFDDNHNDD